MKLTGTYIIHTWTIVFQCSHITRPKHSHIHKKCIHIKKNLSLTHKKNTQHFHTYKKIYMHTRISYKYEKSTHSILHTNTHTYKKLKHT